MFRNSSSALTRPLAVCAAALFACCATPSSIAAEGFHTHLGWSYSDKADLRRGGPVGQVAVHAYTFGMVEEGDWTERWGGSYGLVWRRFVLDRSPDLLLPKQLETLALNLTAETQLSPRWSVRGTISPGIYAQKLVFDSKSFNAPGTLLFTFAPHPELELLLGAGFNPFAPRVVLPLAGVRWAMTETWALTLGLPRTGLAYAPSERLLVHLGATAQGGSFRVLDPISEQDPEGPPRTTYLDYREIRTGVTFDYTIREGLSLNLEGGWVLHRRFEYHKRQHRLSREGGAAYGGISLTSRF